MNLRKVKRHGGYVRKRALAGVHEAFAAAVRSQLKLLCGSAVCCATEVQFFLVHKDLIAPAYNKNLHANIYRGSTENYIELQIAAPNELS